MTFLRWLLGLVLLALGIWTMALNWICFYRAWIMRIKTPSFIPILGALFMCIALLLIPVASLHRLAWMPFVLDWGSLPAIVMTIIWHWRRLRSEAK